MSVISQLFGTSAVGQVGGNAPSTQAQQLQSDARGAAYLSGLSNAQTVEGKITDVKGSQVEIELPNGGTVSAKLDGAMALSKGQTVTFEVRGNNGAQVSLTPLYTNLTMAATASKALEAAGMSVNADTVRMALAMMDEGMGIDRGSLGDMYNLIQSYQGLEGGSIQDLVEMRSLGLPMDPQTIEQYGAFKNYQNQLSEGVGEIADSAVALYDEIVATDGEAEGLQYLKALTDVIAEGLEETAGDADPAAAASAQADSTGAMGSVSDGAAAGDAAILTGDAAPAADAAHVGAMLRELLQAREGMDESGASAMGEAVLRADAAREMDAAGGAYVGAAADGAQNPQGGSAADRAMDALQAALRRAADGADTTEEAHREDSARTGSDMPDAAAQDRADTAAGRVQQELVKLVQSLPGGAEVSRQLEALEATDADMLRLAREAMKALDDAPDGLLSQRLSKLFSSEDFKEVVRGALKESWTLRPEQVADKSNVEALYQKLNAQTKAMTQMLSEVARPESALAQNLSNMSNNLDFMNQMNQMVQYVQLPLRMNGSEATGDLYVYSDKKSLANKDGSVSALLHLDMQHMGAVDVYAAISAGNKVSTRFYLESDEMIDFIAANIHILNERLEQRGYSVTADIVKHDDKHPHEERRLRESAAGSVVAKQSFDVRA